MLKDYVLIEDLLVSIQGTLKDALNNENIDAFKNIIYDKIKKLYEKKFPYNHFLYQEIED